MKLKLLDLVAFNSVLLLSTQIFIAKTIIIIMEHQQILRDLNVLRILRLRTRRAIKIQYKIRINPMELDDKIFKKRYRFSKLDMTKIIGLVRADLGRPYTSRSQRDNIIIYSLCSRSSSYGCLIWGVPVLRPNCTGMG